MTDPEWDKWGAIHAALDTEGVHPGDHTYFEARDIFFEKMGDNEPLRRFEALDAALDHLGVKDDALRMQAYANFTAGGRGVSEGWTQPTEPFDNSSIGRALAAALEVAAPNRERYLQGREAFRNEHDNGKKPHEAIRRAVLVATQGTSNRNQRMRDAHHQFNRTYGEASKADRKARGKSARSKREAQSQADGPIIDGPAVREEAKNFFSSKDSTPQPA